MPRISRVDVDGETYHVINRANAKTSIFETDGDFISVIETLEEVLRKVPIDIFSFCIMPNHWHFSVRPRNDGDLGKFFGKFTQTVTQRWHAYHRTTGSGHLFQGRYKAFLVQTDRYFIQLMKYIEANPLRAGLVGRAEDWKWSSLNFRLNNHIYSDQVLTGWPIQMPKDYLNMVNEQIPKAYLEQIRGSVIRGRPLGEGEWLRKMIEDNGLKQTVRNRGRPRKDE